LPEKALAAQRLSKRTRWIVLLWIVAAISVAGMAIAGPAGDDITPYWRAIQAVGHGNDPYVSDIAALKAYHSLSSHAAGTHEPLIFWYAPLTIPVLRVLSWFPGWLLGPLYWCALAAGFLLQLKAGYALASEKERRWLIYLLPFIVFFPGLLGDATMLCGNVADILYGLILIAAISGWKRNKWFWFYVTVLFASVCKAPMLTLLAFPLLVGRKQWLSASMTGTAGCLLFAVQPLLWPPLFHEFLEAVHVQFDLRHDFGFGPAGVLGRLLWQLKKPYFPATTIAYLIWAVALGILLLALKRHVDDNPHLRQMWIPVALVGTILMDPRVAFHDTPPLTVPLLLISWRALLLVQERLAARQAKRAAAPMQASRPNRGKLKPLLAGLGVFAACNLINIFLGDWVPMELPVLLLVLSSGVWTLVSAEAGSFLPDSLPKLG
jgi:hypothetical protein